MNYSTITSRLVASALLFMLPVSIMAATGGPMRIQSMRSLAMGGTAVAITTDEHALYRNPASLSLVPEPDFNALRFRLGANQDIVDQLSTMGDLIDDTKSQVERTRTLSDLVPGRYVADFAASPLAATIGPNWGIGLFNNVSMQTHVKNFVNPEVEVSLTADAMGLIGFSTEMDFLPDGWVVGTSLGVYSRTIAYDKETGESKFVLESDEFLELVDGESELDVDFASAVGFGLNLGVLMPLDLGRDKGHVGFSVNNIGTVMNSDATVDGGKEIEIPITATIGLGLNTTLPLIGDALIAADYKIVSPDDSFYLNANLGIEKRVWDTFIFRGGINKGYIVGGVGIDFGLIRFDYVNTTDELGSFAGETPATQHIIQLGFVL